MPIEQSILDAAAALHENGQPEFYGYLMARTLDNGKPWYKATGTGTLYRALDRLVEMGHLEARWEAPEEFSESRPRRHLYRLSARRQAAGKDNP